MGLENRGELERYSPEFQLEIGLLSKQVSTRVSKRKGSMTTHIPASKDLEKKQEAMIQAGVWLMEITDLNLIKQMDIQTLFNQASKRYLKSA